MNSNHTAPASHLPKMPVVLNTAAIDNTVVPAKLTWHEDENGTLVPVSDIFGDVYYSLADGLAKSRYVFIEQNHLPERFEQLFRNEAATPYANCFTIAELGFGTGLNVLATWQLWRQIKSQTSNADSPNRPRLHIISTEKYPLTHADLSRSLESWKQRDDSLSPLITQLLTQYPTLVSGCHRLHLDDDITLDLWLGDAVLSLQNLSSTQSMPFNKAHVDAWYLDGFTPSCNESLWTEQIFEQIARLSKLGSTAATFSSACVIKHSLRSAGFKAKKVKGFGHQREMLTATYLDSAQQTKHVDGTDSINHKVSDKLSVATTNNSNSVNEQPVHSYQQVAIIGAGVSGLMAAWSLAQRGMQITLLDKSAPLAGASGNPRALLAPKMTPLAHVADHLHSTSYLYSQRFYKQLDESATASNAPVFEPTATLDLLLKANVSVEQIAQYPEQMATTLSSEQAKSVSELQQQNLAKNLYLPQAGLINPKAFADKVLNHPHITFKQAETEKIITSESDFDRVSLNGVKLHCASGELIEADAVIIATAFDSKSLDARIFEFRKIRGQLSWFEPTSKQLNALPKLPLKYGGYCATFTPKTNDDDINPVTPNTPAFLLGASFVRNQTSTEIRQSEHATNRDKLITAIPELAKILPNESDDEAFSGWQARVGIRAQTPDYHPLVGQVDTQGLIWTLSGMGSKGYAFAPLCAEVLADMMTGQFVPLSNTLLAKLSPHRKSLQKALSP